MRQRIAALCTNETEKEEAVVATVVGVEAEVGEDIWKHAEDLGIMFANFVHFDGQIFVEDVVVPRPS